MNIDNGKEWFGRMKKVHYDGLKTSPLTIDYTIHENLITNKERSKRLLHLKNNQNYIIKCMPLQLSYTVEDKDLSYEGKLDIAYKYYLTLNFFGYIIKIKYPNFVLG